MWTLLLSFALAAEPAPNADVVATKVVQVAPQAFYDQLLNLRNLEGALSACTRKWEFGDKTEGVGAGATLVYKMKSFRRRLTMTLSKVDEGRRVTFDHPGNKGFVTVWTLTPAGDGQDAQATEIDVHTYLQLPPWPLKRYYLNKIQPEWRACQEQAISKLAKGAAAR